MTSIAQYIARHPRFEIVDDSKIDVRVELVVDGIAARLEATPVNLSLQGARLNLSANLREGDNFILEIKCQDSNLHIRKDSTVQWAAEIGDGLVAIGCQFTDAIDWEQMGELFLVDVISPEE